MAAQAWPLGGEKFKTLHRCLPDKNLLAVAAKWPIKGESCTVSHNPAYSATNWRESGQMKAKTLPRRDIYLPQHKLAAFGRNVLGHGGAPRNIIDFLRNHCPHLPSGLPISRVSNQSKRLVNKSEFRDTYFYTDFSIRYERAHNGALTLLSELTLTVSAKNHRHGGLVLN